MKYSSSSRRVRGLTLLEVLVALAVFATAALSVMKAVSQHLNTLGYLEEKTFAAMVADNEMAKIRLSGEIPTRLGGVNPSWQGASGTGRYPAPGRQMASCVHWMSLWQQMKRESSR